MELFTTAPLWFFESSLPDCFRYHDEMVDVGFRQRSALEYDLAATVGALDRFLPFDEATVERLAATVVKAGCRVVPCDIAPLGAPGAAAAGLPSVVVENFTWGWLYEPLHGAAPELARHGRELDGWIGRATAHVQARPVCRRDPASLLVDPVSRLPRQERDETRSDLGVASDEPLVVITLGGYGEALPYLPSLRERPDCRFLITGADSTRNDRNLILFDNDTPLFMPDLMRAADAAVAKLGYGTVAEVWREGVPFLGVTRADFREMPTLEAFARDELGAEVVIPDVFRSGRWVDRLDAMLAKERRPQAGGGAGQAAEVVRRLM